MGNTSLEECLGMENSEIQGIKLLTEVDSYYYDLLDQELVPLSTKYTQGNCDLNRLMCLLLLNKEQFYDRVFPCDQLLEDPSCRWKRAEKVFPGEYYKEQYWDFQYKQPKPTQKYTNKNFAKAMLWLKKHPELLSQICMYPQTFQPGLYRFKFSLNGDYPKEIVIDSLIPIDLQNQYYFCSPMQGGGIWMVLMEKALAKILGSYLKIQSLHPKFIISQITGYPAPQLYQTGQQKYHINLRIKAKSSKYLKIGKQIRIKVAFALWFPLAQYEVYTPPFQKVVFEMISVQQNGQAVKSAKIPTTQIIKDNKLLIFSESGQMFSLWALQQIVHIYNNSQDQLNCNLVAQSDDYIYMSEPSEKSSLQFQSAKREMVINQYKKHHQQLTRADFPTYRMRFMWMGHRGIFCIKNTLNKKQKITFKIKEQFKNHISFEYSPESLQQQIDVVPECHTFFIIIRVKNRQYGQFYEIII